MNGKTGKSKPKTKKTYKKSNGKYKKKNTLVSSNFNKLFGGFLSRDPIPTKQNYRMNYTQTFTLSTGTLGVTGSQQRMCLNGMYDVDTSGLGHQPYSYDQLALLYKRYKVNGVLVKIILSDPSEDGLYLGVQLTNPSNGSAYINGTTSDVLRERQQAFVMKINNTGSQVNTKSFYTSIQAMSGLTSLQFKADPDNFTADVASNPGNVCNLLMALGSDRGVGSATAIVTVDITYYATWYQRVQLDQSTI